MTLADLISQPLTYEDAKALALVFGQAPYDALLAAQAQRPDAQNHVAPVQLTDGRWMVCADLLTEIAPGGMYADGFALLPPELFAQVDVMPWDDAVALLPKEELKF